MHDYLVKPVPAWYGLSAPEAQTLEIHLHPQILENPYINNPVASLRDGSYFERMLGTTFTPPTVDQSWGFDNAFTPLVFEEPWFSARCTFPEINSPKQRENLDESPLLALVPIQASLALLFKGLKFVTVTTNSQQPQLLVVENMLCEAGMDGAAMSVSLTPALADWLSQQPDFSRLEAVEATMRGTYEYFMGHASTMSRFAATCRQPNSIHLQVPGNACGLDPDISLSRVKNEGYELVSHNTDSAPQQLALLMGLAKLHDLVRQTKTPVE